MVKLAAFWLLHGSHPPSTWFCIADGVGREEDTSADGLSTVSPAFSNHVLHALDGREWVTYCWKINSAWKDEDTHTGIVMVEAWPRHLIWLFALHRSF